MSRRRPVVRLVLAIEAATTAVGAILAFAAPGTLIRMTAPVDLDGVGRAVTMQVGATWLVMALLVASSLRLGPGDVRPLRLLFGPLLVGDVLHVVAVLALAHEAGSLPASALGQLAFIALLAGNRLLGFRCPALVLGAVDRRAAATGAPA